MVLSIIFLLVPVIVSGASRGYSYGYVSSSFGGSVTEFNTVNTFGREGPSHKEHVVNDATSGENSIFAEDQYDPIYDNGPSLHKMKVDEYKNIDKLFSVDNIYGIGDERQVESYGIQKNGNNYIRKQFGQLEDSNFPFMSGV